MRNIGKYFFLIIRRGESKFKKPSRTWVFDSGLTDELKM